jgi:hypothetical protein
MNIAKDLGAGASAALTGWASIAHINELLQFIAYLVAIASGAPAAYHYWRAWLDKRKKKD